MIEDIISFIKEKAEEFGAKTDAEFNKPYVFRNNTKEDALKDNGAYFGFIHPDEEASGPFHDFSFTIFPSNEGKPWLVCLGIGSNGFKNDFELANFPGLRRLFSKLVDQNGFCKSDFSDIETNLPNSITGHADIQHIRNTVKTYSKVLPVCQIINDPTTEDGKKIIAAFVAGYAKLRDWPTNSAHRSAINNSLSQYIKQKPIDDEKEAEILLRERKYIILQGAPGTGKTRLAKIVAKSLGSKVFFTQFHAETSYSDFIYGIRPDTKSGVLSYSQEYGVFTNALRHAIETNENTVLIIDEINRANLSNVLGPIFYLFEHKQENSDIEIEITPEIKITKIPDNFYVVATMNTADRSLAVVDFALRRRFAWYNITPQIISSTDFFKDEFSEIHEIFNWYANTCELTLEPGQGYFIASSKEEIINRIKYEIYPLIREYLQEGLLSNAKEEFNNYFMSKIGLSLYE